MIGDWVMVVADEKLFPDEFVGKTIPCKVQGFSYESKIPSYPEKSVGIDLKPQIGLMVRVANNFGFMYFKAERLSPIPLTPEVFERNGFEKVLDKNKLPNYQIKWNRNPNLYFTIFTGVDGYWNPVGFGVTIGGVLAEVDFVHQLQHALRLCGINKEIVLL